MRKQIACCMIVKNEEEILEKCLKTVQGLVDKYIIIDTGSTDKTKTIIEKYGTAYDIPFVNFVDTKNEALKMVKEFGGIDYVLWMDADEILYQGLDKLREYAENDVKAVSCLITEGSEDYNDVATQYHRIRMFKNDDTYKFVGPGVHECLVGEGEVISDDSILVRHEHLKKDKAITARERFLQYINLLNIAFEQNPEDHRAWFYLGRTYMDLNEPMQAVSAFEQYLSLPDNHYRDERWQACYDIAKAWKSTGDYEQAISACNRALEIDGRRAETNCLLGDIFFSLQNYDKAIEQYLIASSLPIPTDVVLFLHKKTYNEYPKDQLFLCYYKTNQFDKAEEIIKEIAGTDTRLLNNLWWNRKKTKQIIFLTLGVTPEPIWGGILDTQGVHGVETTYIEIAKEFAEMGNSVFLFCTTDREHVYDGVYYVPYQNLSNYMCFEPDLIITSRWFDALYLDSKSKKIIWLQDAHFADPNHPDAFDKADAIICSSLWLRCYIAERFGERIDAKKLHIIPLGLRKELFMKDIVKEKGKVIYSSNPDRGLYILADMWPELTEKIPDIHLTILYGWEGLKTWGQSDEWKNSVEGQRAVLLDKLSKFSNVNFTGRVTHARVAEEMLSSELMLYCNNFPETFCCHPDNLIFTDSGFKKITDITMSDKLLTHCNRFRDIEKIMSRNFKGELTGIELNNSRADIPYFTNEHPILCMKKNEAKKIKGVKYFGYSPIHLNIEPQWREVGDIEKGDFIAYSFPENNNHCNDDKYYFINDFIKINRNYKVYPDGRIKAQNRIDQKGCPEFVNIDNDFARFLGLYFAEGSYSQSTINFSLHAKEQEYSDFIINYIDKNLGFNYKVSVNGNQRRIDISSYIFGRWLISKIGHSAAYKNIPDFMYNQPKHIKESFIRGIFEGDACFTKNGIRLELATKIGIMNLKMLMNQIGYYPTFSKVFTKRTEGLSSNYYSLALSASQCEILFNKKRNTLLNKNYIEHKGKIFYKVDGIHKKEYNGKVYNFEVEEDHSYVSSFLTVHNCLTTYESQLAGTPVITTDMGALSTTVNRNNNFLLQGSPYSKIYQNKFIDTAVELMVNSKETLKDYQNKNRICMMNTKCDWKDIAEQWKYLIWSL